MRQKNKELAARDQGPLVDVREMPAALDTAGRINYYHGVSKCAGKIAIQAALAAGLELLKVQLANPGRLFDDWVDANCEFSRRTAFNYISALRHTIGKEFEMARLVNGSDEESKGAIVEMADRTDSKSLTELYVDLGIVRKSPSNMGGRREGAGRPSKDAVAHMQMKAQAAELANDPVVAAEELNRMLTELEGWAIVRDQFAVVDAGEISSALSRLGDVVERAKTLLRRTRPRRTR